MLMTEGWVGGLRKHPIGRVDQLEDRYLGMVEAPSSNLGTSTRNNSSKHCLAFAKTCFVLSQGQVKGGDKSIYL